jgi:hypothetical protein
MDKGTCYFFSNSTNYPPSFKQGPVAGEGGVPLRAKGQSTSPIWRLRTYLYNMTRRKLHHKYFMYMYIVLYM